MAKKIKSFTVDEDIYSALVDLFKANKVQSSLSLFVNNSMKRLLDDIHEYTEAVEEFPDLAVPLGFVISQMVNDAYKEQPNYELMGEKAMGYAQIACGEYWLDKYGAFKMQIPVEFYSHIRMGGYALSADRKYLVHKESGKKYLPTSRITLRPIGEEES